MCLLKEGFTPLIHAAEYSKSPGVVEALEKGNAELLKEKANWKARNKVRHLEGNRRAPHALIGVCSVKDGSTPLTYAAGDSKS